MYYARLTRAHEERAAVGVATASSTTTRFHLPKILTFEQKDEHEMTNDHLPHGGHDHQQLETDHERERAELAQAMRVASWGAVFYLITTDIFGPLSVP